MRLILFLVAILLSIKAFSQEEAFYIEYDNKDLSYVLEDLESVYKVIFSYEDSYIKNIKVSLEVEERTMAQTLVALEKNTGLIFNQLSGRYIIITLNNDQNSYVNKLDLVTIKSYIAKGIEKTNKGNYIINPQKLGILPGLTEPDVLESIQLLPGVLSPNETATGFFVRGGFSDQNRLIWDGINLYHKGHLFGMISPLNPNMTSEINFINKGTHPRYGERLSSVIDITSKDDITDQFKGEIGVNGLNLDALIELPLIKNKLNVLASFRTSYTGVIETPTFEKLAEKVFESTKINQNPNGNNSFYFNDYNLKLNYKPNSKNALFASFISIDNRLDYILQQSDENRIFNDRLNISNLGYSVGWERTMSETLKFNTKAFFSDYNFDYNFITTEDVQVSDFEKRNTIFDSGISLEIDYNPSQRFNYNFGYEYTLKDVAYAFLNTTDLTFILDTEDTTVQSHSLYGNAVYNNPKLFDISLGLRSSYFKELSEVKFEPRIQLLKEINTNFSIQASSEIKNQILSEVNETIFSDLSLENNVWRLSNGSDFPIRNSFQTTLGFIYNNNSYSLDVDAYYKELKNITALSLGFLNPENAGLNIGEQTIYGIDVFFKKRLNNFNLWTSYSFNNSRNKFEDINNNNSFKSKTNITHSFSTALSYNFKDLQFSLGWKYQTGRPFTEASSIEDGLAFDNGINTGQLPDYHRLDFSSTYSFKFDDESKFRGKVGLSIRNLYNRRSLISREYRGNNSLDDPIRIIDRFSLGFTPNLLFRIYW